MEDVCPTWRGSCKWLSGVDRAALAVLVLALVGLNGLNIVLASFKLRAAQNHPVVTISSESRIVMPSLSVVLCSSDPAVPLALESIVCAYFLYPISGETVARQGPCEGVLGLTIAVYSCAWIPSVGGPGFNFRIGGDFESVTMFGATEACQVDKSACASTPIYFATYADSFDVDEFRGLRHLGTLSASPLKPEEHMFLQFDMSRSVTLAGKSVFTLNPRVSPIGNVAKSGHGVTANTSFMLEINDLSFFHKNLVYTETISYDFLDLIASIAAVSSLTYSVFKLCFPSSPTVPLHFRCGRHARERRMDKVIDSLRGETVPYQSATNKVGPADETANDR